MNIDSILLFVGTREIIIILVIVLVFFGGRKIPELMRGSGRGVKEFKDGVDGKLDESSNDSTTPDKKA